jgi:hypothetical protein
MTGRPGEEAPRSTKGSTPALAFVRPESTGIGRSAAYHPSKGGAKGEAGNVSKSTPASARSLPARPVSPGAARA